MSANLGTDLLCEELVQRKFSVKQIYMQGDILPNYKAPRICRALPEDRLATDRTANKTETIQVL